MSEKIVSRAGSPYRISWDPEARLVTSRFRFSDAPELAAGGPMLDAVFDGYMSDMEAFAAGQTGPMGHVVDTGEFLLKTGLAHRERIGRFMRDNRNKFVVGAYVSDSLLIRGFLASMNIFVRRNRRAFSDAADARAWAASELRRLGVGRSGE